MAAHEGVVLLLQGRDHVRGFLRLGDLLVDLRADAQPGSAQFVHREHQSRRAPDGFQQRQGGRRVVALRQVVGDEHGEAHRIGPGLAQPVLQQVPGAAGHLNPLEPGLIAADQLPAGPVCDHPRLAGVRHGHGNRVEPDAELDAEPPHQSDGRRDEPFPLVVRLRPGEQQEGDPGGVAQFVHCEHRILVVLPAISGEGHQRSP